MNPRRSADDRGVVLVLVAIVIVAIMVVVAIVIDLGQARTDKQTNKSIADAAAAAGAAGLRVGPWQAVCDAYSNVRANAKTFSAFTTESWTNGDGSTTYPSSPGACPTSAPYTGSSSTCTSSSVSWARFHGTVDDGRVIVDIKAAYAMPDAAFPEDQGILNDDGDPCTQVAVIVKERRAAAFGRVMGVDELSSRVRSVARQTVGPQDIAALTILERTDCQALVASTNTGGGPTTTTTGPTTSGGQILVTSVGNRPGIIQVDSDGSATSTGDNCNGGKKVVEGSALPASQGANIRAQATTGTPSIPGQIGINAIKDHSDRAYTEPCALPGDAPATCTMAPSPVWRSPVGRGQLDARYVPGLNQLKQTATDAISTHAGYTPLTTIVGAHNCNDLNHTLSGSAGPYVVADQKVYIDCDLSLSGGGLRFTAADSTIVAAGTISIGSSATLVVDDPRSIYVQGDTSTNGNPVGFNVAGDVSINASTAVTCDGRHASSPTKTTKLVVVGGAFQAGAQGTVRMCSTTVLMLPGLPTSTVGNPIANNPYTGVVRVGGAGIVDWSAPNRVSGIATASDWLDQEDLALWTEAAGGTSNSSTVAGQGSSKLAGVYALPQANPFTFTGTGTGTIEADAQFWTRKLRVSGQAVLRMAPNPNDSIPIFGISLVR